MDIPLLCSLIWTHHCRRSHDCIIETNYQKPLGPIVWNEINNVFDSMPLAAVVDGYIFCTHGGIPEERKYEQLGFKRAVNSIPVPLCDPELQASFRQA